jgi:hypothetical protein
MREIKLYQKHLDKIFPKIGYIKHKNGFVMDIKNQGRFHAQQICNEWFLHFDVLVEGKHSVFDMPITLRKERNRITSLYSRRLKLIFAELKNQEKLAKEKRKLEKRIKHEATVKAQKEKNEELYRLGLKTRPSNLPTKIAKDVNIKEELQKARHPFLYKLIQLFK